MVSDDLSKRLIKAMPNVGMNVNIQDQTTPVLINGLSQKKGETTLASPTTKEDKQITVTDATGIAVGDDILITGNSRIYVGKVTSILSAPIIDVDTPINADYSASAFVSFGTEEASVDGSITPQIFSLKSLLPEPIQTLDITRIIFSCLSGSAVSLDKFGDLTALTNGIVIRKNNGELINVLNAKSNFELANIMFDFDIYAAATPSQGIDGFISRLTFGGQSKIGVTVRLEPDEDLELLIQDDLSGLTSFKVIAEGHVVE